MAARITNRQAKAYAGADVATTPSETTLDTGTTL